MVKKKTFKNPKFTARRHSGPSARYRSAKIPKGLGISTEKAPATIGARIGSNRDIGFSAGQHIRGIETAIYGSARKSSVGTQKVSLGMGRTGGTISKRLKQQAHSGRRWSSAAGRSAAVKTSKRKLRVKAPKLPRLRVN